MDDRSMERKEKRKVNDKMLRWVLIISGSISLGLGVLGIFLPVLPTTPFLLLAAACYVRSSERLNNWLLNHKWLGPYIRHYREDKAIPLRGKIITIALLWITILSSAIFAVDILIVRVILILIAVGVTIHVLSFRTLKK
jgi:uncharacterized membrane protein YbaN (DUF454 family)